MNWLHILAAVLAIALFAYLVAALLYRYCPSCTQLATGQND